MNREVDITLLHYSVRFYTYVRTAYQARIACLHDDFCRHRRRRRRAALSVCPPLHTASNPFFCLSTDRTLPDPPHTRTDGWIALAGRGSERGVWRGWGGGTGDGSRLASGG